MPSANNYRVNPQVEIPRLNGNQNTGGTEFKPPDNASLMDMIFQFLDEHSPALSPSNDLPFKQKLPGVMRWRDQVPAGYEPSPIDFREMKTDYENSSLESAPSPTGSVFSDASSYADESVESDGPATPPSQPTLLDKKPGNPININLDIPSRPFSFVWSSKSPAAPADQRGGPKAFATRSECTLQRSAQYDQRKGPNFPARPILSNFNASKSEYHVEPPKAQSATCPSPPQPMFATITNVADIIPPEFLPFGSPTPEEKRKSIANQLRINTEKLTPVMSTPETPGIRSGISRTPQMSPRHHVGAFISPKPTLSPASERKTNPISIPGRSPLRNIIGNQSSPASKYTPPTSAKSGSRYDDDVSPCSYRRPFESPLSRNVDAIISPQRLDSNGVSPLSPPKSNASPIIQRQNQVMSPSMMSPHRQVQAQDTKTPTSARSVHFARVDYTVTIPARERMKSLGQETPKTPPPVQEKKFGSAEWAMALHIPSDSEHSS